MTLRRWARAVFAFAVLLLFAVVGCSGSLGNKDLDAGGEDAGSDVSANPAPPFNVVGAASTSSTTMTVTFDAPPNPGEAASLASYTVPGLVVASVAQVEGAVVTLVTAPQAAQPYRVSVSGVRRQSDGKALTFKDASFIGRAPFRIASATTPSAITLAVTFDAPPHPIQAVAIANYVVAGLTLTGTPRLEGNRVTLTTSAQTGQSYSLTVNGVTRASDGEPLSAKTATFSGTTTFNIADAQSIANRKVRVTFDAPPNSAQAGVLANYTIAGLTLSGAPALAGNAVTLTTSAQATQGYTVQVANVTRASDLQPLVTNSFAFNGRTSFNVVAAASTSATSLTVTYDAPPSAAAATAANYTIAGLTVNAASVVGNVATLTTSVQSALAYEVSVANVVRAADNEPLTDAAEGFTGRAPFDVASAGSTNSITLKVVFNAAPNVAQATTLANYAVPTLTLLGTPTLVGNEVTISTAPQTNATYAVTVSNVTRASDGEALRTATANFAGTPVLTPTVTNVTVLSTAPDNGTTPFNTGTTQVRITGTQFLTVDCSAATKPVRLDDLDGGGGATNTRATACTVDSATQITATFPPGIRTNGNTGWNVIVKNVAAVNENTTSSVAFVPKAGLLLSEVFTGALAGAGANEEYVEIWNPTATAIDVAVGTYYLHFRSAAGADTNAMLGAGALGHVIPSHGFLLFVSKESVAPVPVAAASYTFDAALEDGGGVYLSRSASPNIGVIDKVGWGAQPAPGYEGTAAAPNPLADTSIARLPGLGHATDTDVNADDWTAPSLTLTPRGVDAAPEP